MTLDRGGASSKTIDRESHRGASQWSTWTGCIGWVLMHFPRLWENDGMTHVFLNMTKLDNFLL